jgi:hypothetical protein
MTAAHRLSARLALFPFLLTAVAAFGQSEARGTALDSRTDPGPAIQEVRLRVDDFKTKKDLGYLLEGDVLELEVGDSVIVRVVAIPASDNRAVRYPEATFKLLSGARRIDLSRHSVEHGSVVVHAVRPDDPANSGSTTLVEFAVTSPLNAHRKLLGGTFSVVVKDPKPTPPPPNSGASAETITAVLYRAILLREADAPGAAPKIDTIRQRGFSGVYDVAVDMAASRESREDVYQRSVTVVVGGREVTRPVNDEDRLLALYRELLGIQNAGTVRADEWNRQLDLLSRGRLDEVLRDLLGRREFADRFGFDWQAPGRARPR